MRREDELGHSALCCPKTGLHLLSEGDGLWFLFGGVVAGPEEEEGLTWYDLKQVSSWFVRVGCELVDLTPLQRDAALKRRQKLSVRRFLCSLLVLCHL